MGALCIEVDCESAVRSRGLCEKHYRILRMSGQMGGQECGFEGCDRIASTRGLCRSHYQQEAVYGIELRPLAVRHNGRTCIIEGCSSVRSTRVLCRAHHQRGVKYNLSPIQLCLLLSTPACEICECEFLSTADIHIDHDHSCCPGSRSCGECIRGVLCGDCNLAIGIMGDSPARLRRAVEYLTQPD